MFAPENETLPPCFTVEEAVRLAFTHFGADVQASPLPSYVDQNFHLRRTDGCEFVLKIAFGGERREFLELQREAMEWVGRTGEAAIGAHVLPTCQGEYLAVIAGAAGDRHFLRLCSYLPGRVLGGIERSPELLRQTGQFLGGLTRRLDGFWHPAASREMEWDLRHVGRALPGVIGAVKDPARRELVEAYLAQFEAYVPPILVGLRGSVIHGDLNDQNLLVVGDRGAERVTAIIDFADVVHSHTICDLAIAVAYGIQRCDDPLAAAASMVAGYHTVFPLEPDELAVVYQLACMRICTSVCMSARQQKLDPGNDYLAVSEAPGWETLELLRNVDPESAGRAIAGACGVRARSRRPQASREETLATRLRHVSGSVSLSYDEPLELVRGWMQYLYDDVGRRYLDCINNVCHVGHAHPRVVAAVAGQMALLNTNSRYLHPLRARYVQLLAEAFPDPLSIVFLVCSGSEANDLALRLARAHTGGDGVVALEGAYHGTTQSVLELSPYKMKGAGGSGLPPHVEEAAMPDPFRGQHRRGEADLAERYAEHVNQAFARLAASGIPPAAFIVEPLLGCGGQVVPPDGYLAAAFRHARAAGAVCIADEVQIGFGRVGTHLWGFETQGVVPDIVTLGKPIGNGHPVAAVVTTPDIARSFETGMEYFNTFGGNPVSCAAGLAVFAVMAEEGLQARALEVGAYLRSRLCDLAERHALIGDVRGLGLFLGVELVRDRETLEPAAADATAVVERLKAEGILVSTDGPDHNVLKIKPPLQFSKDNADQLADALDRALP